MSRAVALRRSGSNSLSALLRAEEETRGGGEDGAATKQRAGRRGRRRLLRLPLGAAGGCRVCDCGEVEHATAAAPSRRALGDGEEEGKVQEEEEDDIPAALQCFSWKKGGGTPQQQPSAAEDAVMVAVPEEASLSVLPDDVMEMVLCRLPLSSLLAARCVCRRWRDLTIAQQFVRLRREGPHLTPWLFLFGVEGDGWSAGATTAVHALDVAAHRWRRVGASALKGRFLFSVAAVGDELYVVGGQSGRSDTGSVKTKTHKGVLVYSPLNGTWRKAAPMRAARSRPVLGVFEMSVSRSILHARAEKHVRHNVNGNGKFRLGGTSAVYEDPHLLSLRRLHLRDMLNEDCDPAVLTKHHHHKVAKKEEQRAEPMLALIAVGGRGLWDEPLVSGEIYNPVSDKWVEIAGFPSDVGLACSGAVCGDMFYVYCESDMLVGYHLDNGSWAIIQTSRPPPRLRDYAPTLVCCASGLFMVCVSWCDGQPASRRDKVVRKVFELDHISLRWAEASLHPDAPMDPNAAFAAGQDRIYAVEMFRIFGKVLDFATVCHVTGGTEQQSWSRIARSNVAPEADAMSSRLKSMAVLRL